MRVNRDSTLLCVDKEQGQENDIILHVIGQIPQPRSTDEEAVANILPVDQIKEDRVAGRD